MSREIKFRAWHTDEDVKEMDYSPEIHGEWSTIDINEEIRLCGESGYILMQYTGLNDSKRTEEFPDGQPIYEGDIIEFDKQEWGGDGNIHVVSWDGVRAEWCWGGGTASEMEWRTVIGNIHQNPELL